MYRKGPDAIIRERRGHVVECVRIEDGLGLDQEEAVIFAFRRTEWLARI
jgi:hypothetical protein